MPSPPGHVLLVLHTHLPWVLGHGRWPHGEDWLYEAVAECYLPLLRVLDRLAADGVEAHVTIGITPVLAEMLAAPRFQEGFVKYCDERRDLAEEDRKAFQSSLDEHGMSLSAAWSTFYEDAKRDFLETYGGDLLRAFRRLQDAERIEIITSAATHGYLPLLGRSEAVEAQIAAGVATYRHHFGRAPRGIWLPECAYHPGQDPRRPKGGTAVPAREGLEEVLARHGLRFFFVDTHLVAGGAPLGSYDELFEGRLDASQPTTGLSPHDIHGLTTKSRHRIAVFARDPRSSVQVWSADYGYPGDGAYLEFHRKRGMGGLRYWRITDRNLPLEAKILYDPQAAAERVRAHAAHFAGLVRDTLREHRERTGRMGVVVAPFDTELFGHWWFEGPQWFEAVLRDLSHDMAAVTASEQLAGSAPRTRIRLPEGSWGQGGHHWVWWNDATRSVWELVYRAENSFLEALEATRHRRDPVHSRILSQLARELFLLESSDWPFLITTGTAKDYAELRARSHFEAFERLREMLARAFAEGIPPEDEAWLSEIERRDSLFPRIEPEWWSRGE